MRNVVRQMATALLLGLLCLATPTSRASETGKKDEAVASIEKHKAELIKLSDLIWAFAETALREIAEGAARIAGVEAKFTVQTGCYEMLVNETGAKLLQQNLNWLGPIQYTEQEMEFAHAIQVATGTEPKGLDGAIKPLETRRPDPPGGSTDVGDVSWVVPTLHLSVTTAPESTWHAWPVVASGGMSIGHKGMTHAAKTLAAAMVDLFEDAKVRSAVQAEFQQQTKGFVYKPYIAPGPPPIPKQ